MMKKLTSLLLSAALMISLLACGAFAAKTKSGVRIAGLKGPTTMGLVNLLDMERSGKASQHYDLQLYGAADEIVPKLIKGELDMAAIPANLAATLYQKTNGGIQVMAVNTLGVLYVVEKGDSIHCFADLKGRTILSTGKGTTPEYVLRYLLNANGIDPDKDVDIAVTDGELRITAHRQAKSEHKDKNGYRSEFQYGSFSRTLTLPPGASPDAVTATYKDGVLEVRVPVAELPPPEASKIPITRG